MLVKSTELALLKFFFTSMRTQASLLTSRQNSRLYPTCAHSMITVYVIQAVGSFCNGTSVVLSLTACLLKMLLELAYYIFTSSSTLDS